MGADRVSLWSADELAAPPRASTVTSSAYRRFSTRGLSDAERVERWEEHNERSLVALDCRSLDAGPLLASEVNLLLPHLTFARVGATPHLVERGREQIVRSSTDGAALYFSLAGEAFFYHRDGVMMQRPGTLLVCDVDQPFLRGFAQGLQEFVITVPRAIFEAVAHRPLPKSPVMMQFSQVPDGDERAAALARLVRDSLADPRFEDLAAIEDRAVDLLGLLFGTEGATTAVARRQEALVWIRRNLRDPSISVSTVASAIGVSERHLARAFEETGVGVARTILELRLELAHRLLSSTGAPAVQDVGAYCGFVSSAHFGRVFRERFELTPAEVRRAAAHS